MKRIMFDFDGVVMTNRTVQKRISNLCVQYISDATTVSRDRARHLNATMYPLLGHSCKLANDGDMTKFNSYVYSDKHIKECMRHLTSFDAERMENVFGVMDEYRHSRDITSYIFTDAPERWVRETSRALGINIPNHVRVISSAEFIGAPKCDPSNACVMRSEFGNAGVILVDDSPIILKNFYDNTEWELVYMADATPARERSVRTHRMSYISSELFQ